MLFKRHARLEEDSAKAGQLATSEPTGRHFQQSATTIRSNVVDKSDERRSLAEEYKKESFFRIAAKSAFAGSAGLFLTPLFSPGTFPFVAVIGGINAAGFTAFYDIVREAFTAVTVSDTPLSSAIAGALSGAH
jgi:hypothetical protein